MIGDRIKSINELKVGSFVFERYNGYNKEDYLHELESGNLVLWKVSAVYPQFDLFKLFGSVNSHMVHSFVHAEDQPKKIIPRGHPLTKIFKNLEKNEQINEQTNLF